MPPMDYSLLRMKIRACGLTQKECAHMIGVSEGQLNRKLAGDFVFRQDEIHQLCAILEISPAEIGAYFFNPMVEKTQLLEEG